MQARYYDPVIGRFYSNDPVGFTGDITTFNRYSYVGNNPYKYIDPDGKSRRIAKKLIARQVIKLDKAMKKAATRKQAMSQAKRDAKVPKSQQPLKVEKVKMTDSNKQTVKDSDGKVVNTTEYTHKTTDGNKVVIQDHSAGHKDFGGDAAKPHVNVRPASNTKTGKVEGTKEHYIFEKKK